MVSEDVDQEPVVLVVPSACARCGGVPSHLWVCKDDRLLMLCEIHNEEHREGIQKQPDWSEAEFEFADTPLD